jgi:hypothetical protein
VVVNCETITGPGFVISLRAVDMEASLRGLTTEVARAKAEAMAWQWAASSKPPQNPDATIARVLREEVNSAAVHSVRLDRAKSDKLPGKAKTSGRRVLDAI